MFTDTLGDWLELQRRRADFWKKLFFLALILLLLGNVIVKPKPYEHEVHPAGRVENGALLDEHGAADTHGEAAMYDAHGAADAHSAADEHGGKAKGFFDVDAPHFVLDKWPGFWPAFSLLASVGMILVLKKVVAKVLGRKEDFYAE